MASVFSVSALVAAGLALIQTPPFPAIQFAGLFVVATLVAILIFYAAVIYPLADRDVLRLQAQLEAEHPRSSFIILKSA